MQAEVGLTKQAERARWPILSSAVSSRAAASLRARSALPRTTRRSASSPDAAGVRWFRPTPCPLGNVVLPTGHSGGEVRAVRRFRPTEGDADVTDSAAESAAPSAPCATTSPPPSANPSPHPRRSRPNSRNQRLAVTTPQAAAGLGERRSSRATPRLMHANTRATTSPHQYPATAR